MIHSRALRCLTIYGVIFLATMFMLSSCSGDTRIRIGILAELSGLASDIGISTRNGVLLAVEEVNDHGGIGGRTIELLIRNIPQDKTRIPQTVAELGTAEVSAIVGPATSASALLIVPEINRLRIPTISPTVSTTLLAEKDDYFFRVNPDSTGLAIRTTEYAYHHEGIRNLVVVYDSGNSEYTEPLFEAINDNFARFGDTQVTGLSFISSSGYDFFSLTQSIKRREANGLIILASGIDTALICQQLAKLKVRMPIFASDWALTEELIEFGGDTVEGVKVFHSFQRDSDTASYRDFSLAFQKRFGHSPDFASTNGYNVMKILLQALNKESSPSPRQIKDAILGGSPYMTMQGEIRLDRYGDAERQYSLQIIRNGRIVTFKPQKVTSSQHK